MFLQESWITKSKVGTFSKEFHFFFFELFCDEKQILKKSKRNKGKVGGKKGETTHLVVICDLHHIHSCVDVKVRQREQAGLSGLQRAARTLAVVPQPGKRVQTLPSILPLHLNHPLLVQGPDMPHWLASKRYGGRPKGLVSTNVRRANERGPQSCSWPQLTTSPKCQTGRGWGGPLQAGQSKTCKSAHPHVELFPQGYFMCKSRREKNKKRRNWIDQSVYITSQKTLDHQQTFTFGVDSI